MTDDEQTTSDVPTAQIEATFGNITVYVTGDSQDEAQDTFDHVWETMMETPEILTGMPKVDNEPSRTFD